MSASDNISTEDWDIVHELSLKIVNAEAEAEANIYTNQLFQYLDKLEAKYGVLPSILATRADYLPNLTEKETLLKRAYCLAEASNDAANMKEIAHSLAELYIEDLEDPLSAKIWIQNFSEYISYSSDKTSSDELKRLREVLNLYTRSLKTYKTIIEGKNCWADLDGTTGKFGFFTTRMVQEINETRASEAAPESLTEELKSRLLNDSFDPPVIAVNEAIEIELTKIDTIPKSGFTWYREDTTPSN